MTLSSVTSKYMDCSIHALNRAAWGPPLKSQSEVPSPVAPLGCAPTALAAAKVVMKACMRLAAVADCVSPCCGTLSRGLCILGVPSGGVE